ncbi:MerR family transcriptional regulator [Nakamurella sp. UYEF19]|uniref:MerR family transcriptional regulator n=1 Tax=Nakamurella sp. UYEF19 TaxID=1756392 RepID=UPI00339577B4
MPAGEDARGVYGISVAAELTDVGVQNIRAYERRGLLEPARTDGGTRRYSNDDLTRLRRIRDLLAGGLNLAGIILVLRLEGENADLRAEVGRPGRRGSNSSGDRAPSGGPAAALPVRQ